MSDSTLWEKHLEAVQLFYQETFRSALLADPKVSKEAWVKEANEELKAIKKRVISDNGNSYNGIHLAWWRPLSADELTDHAHFVSKELVLSEYRNASKSE